MKINKKRIIGAFSLVVILALCLTVFLVNVYATSYTDDLVPVMTSDTTPEGQVLYSTQYSSNCHYAYKVFGNTFGTSSTIWCATTNIGYIGYKFTSPKKITKYTIQAVQDAATLGIAPKNWIFEGSNDGSSWTTLDTQSNITNWANNEKKAFTFNNINSYLYYRLNVSANNGYTYLQIDEIEMMEDAVILPSIPTNLSALSSNGSSPVNLSWDSVTDATSYKIYRGTSTGTYDSTPLATVDAPTTTYSDSAVSAGSTYYYVVTAVNADGESGYSNEASVTLDAPPAADGNRGILSVTMVNGFEKEYDLTKTEIDAFISWYDNRANGSGKAYYTFDKAFNKGPFSSRKDNIVFDKIMTYEVMEYNQ